VGSGDEHETDGELGDDDVDEDVEVPFVIAAGELEAADMEDLLAVDVETFFDTDSVLACLRGGEEGSGLDRFIAVEDVFKERAPIRDQGENEAVRRAIALPRIRLDRLPSPFGLINRNNGPKKKGAGVLVSLLSIAEVTAAVAEDIAVADALEGTDEARGREMVACGTIDN